MAVFNAGEFRKGIKVIVESDPYEMVHCEFVKPGKGQALYKCKMRNLLRGSLLDRTYRYHSLRELTWHLADRFSVPVRDVAVTRKPA